MDKHLQDTSHYSDMNVPNNQIQNIFRGEIYENGGNMKLLLSCFVLATIQSVTGLGKTLASDDLSECEFSEYF